MHMYVYMCVCGLLSIILRQVLMYPRLALNSLCSLGWWCTSDLPAFPSGMLWLKVCTTKLGIRGVRGQSKPGCLITSPSEAIPSSAVVSSCSLSPLSVLLSASIQTFYIFSAYWLCSFSFSGYSGIWGDLSLLHNRTRGWRWRSSFPLTVADRAPLCIAYVFLSWQLGWGIHGGLVGILCLMLAVGWDVSVLPVAPHVLIAYLRSAFRTTWQKLNAASLLTNVISWKNESFRQDSLSKQRKCDQYEQNLLFTREPSPAPACTSLVYSLR